MPPFKDIVRQLVPPVLLPAVRRLRRSAAGRPGPVEWEYVPEGWRKADTAVKGWNVGSVVETQRRKWHDFTANAAGPGPLGIAHEAATVTRENPSAHNTVLSFGYVLALAARSRARVSVLDYGGGLGNYFVLGRALLPPEIGLDYSCFELPLMCEVGRELGSGIAFESDLDAALSRRYDLVFASSAAHYAEDWRRLLARLAEAAEDYLFLTRTPVVETAPSFVVVQRPYAYGYDTEYLCWFLNRRELLGHIEAHGMALVREFIVDEQPLVKGAPEQCRYRGFLFRRVGAPSQAPSRQRA